MKLINIRNNSFETNSSSSHSLVLPSDLKNIELELGDFTGDVYLRYFGWEDAILTSPIDKFSYILADRFDISYNKWNNVSKEVALGKLSEISEYVKKFFTRTNQHFSIDLKHNMKAVVMDVCSEEINIVDLYLDGEIQLPEFYLGIDHVSSGNSRTNLVDEFEIVFNPSIAILTTNDNSGTLNNLGYGRCNNDSYMENDSIYWNEKIKELEEKIK